jgi:putative addiction module antidote
MATHKTLQLKQIGNSLGVILPVDVLTELGVRREVGATIALDTCPATGRLEMSAEDPEFRRKLDALRKVMGHYDDALRELAK